MKKRERPDKKKIVKTRRIAYTAASMIFMMTLAFLFAFSFDFLHRPTFSESEKRKLAAFPVFSVETLLNGDYFEGISNWFSDTFPFRDAMVGVASDIKKCIGIGQTVYNFSENSADVIPEVQQESQSFVDVTVVTPDKNTQNDAEKPTLPAGDKYFNKLYKSLTGSRRRCH